MLYDKTSLVVDVNAARRELFTKKGRQLENLPPTKLGGTICTLYEHKQLAIYLIL